ncbi:site-specific DNA-methyltransferase, partial [bacterium]|nr:site-specific DNA-methyltransferase [bacterium]
MLDQAELDFGIYRILNQKRADIEQYLYNDLEPQVRELLQQNSQTGAETDKVELQKLETTLLSAGIDPETSPKVLELRAKLTGIADLSVLEGEVFSHLATFFRRYYEGGDFMSMRRYKKDVYAIPYEGEEVKLHWANADQYYIKTGEYFQNYTFKLADDRLVHFKLRDASTEQNNNKAQADQERRFNPMPKGIKQKDLQTEAFQTLKSIVPAEFITQVLAPAPTESLRNRTLLEKHINDYVSRNSFDYFIHKDLGAFLRRELDFYLKNEVLFIDDINARRPEEFLQYLAQMKTIKAICDKLITFLAQLEDFQKKLWLKKKMVVETNYCITLDRVPRELYSQLIACDEQRAEWVRLFAIDEIRAEAPANN